MDQVYLRSSPSSPVIEINNSLKTLYALLGAGKEDRCAFASGGQDIVKNILISHYFENIRETGKNHYLILPCCQISSCPILKKLQTLGCSVKKLPLNDQGQLTKEALLQSINPRCSFLSLPWAHGLTGVIQPLDEIADVCKEQGISLHIDVAYALGKLFFRFQDLEADYLSLDGALLGVQGIGAVLVRKGIRYDAEGALPALDTLKSFIYALDTWMHHFDHLSTETARLRDRFEKGLSQQLKEAAHILFTQVERLPNVSVVAFPGIAAEMLCYLLQKKGIHASIGGDEFLKLSSILMSYGYDSALAHTALSFSLSYQTTEQEIDYAVEHIAAIVQKMRPLSKELL